MSFATGESLECEKAYLNQALTLDDEKDYVNMVIKRQPAKETATELKVNKPPIPQIRFSTLNKVIHSNLLLF